MFSQSFESIISMVKYLLGMFFRGAKIGEIVDSLKFLALTPYGRIWKLAGGI